MFRSELIEELFVLVLSLAVKFRWMGKFTKAFGSPGS